MLIDDVAAALELSGFDARSLVIEITESTLMREGASTIDRLNALKALGVRVTIDDFGRVLVARVSAPVPRRHPQDRSLIHRRYHPLG